MRPATHLTDYGCLFSPTAKHLKVLSEVDGEFDEEVGVEKVHQNPKPHGLVIK